MNIGTATERAMKRALDGTFTKVGKEGGVMTVRVEPDYQPSYARMFGIGHVLADGPIKPRLKRIIQRFSAEDDRIIIAMKRERKKIVKIARELGRRDSAVADRIVRLKRMGKI